MVSNEILLTYNVEYGHNLTQILDLVSNLTPTPDILCFQEFPQPNAGIERLLKNLGYDYRFAPALNKYGQTFGQLTAVAPGMKILEHQVVDFGLSLQERLYGKIKGFSGKRSALITAVKSSDRLIQVVNIHQPLMANFDGRSRNIIEVISGLNSEQPALFTGDFNNIHMNRAKGHKKLVDYMARFGFVDSGLNQPTFLKPIAHQLDFVFARGRKPLNPRIIDSNLSDHKPVVVEIH